MKRLLFILAFIGLSGCGGRGYAAAPTASISPPVVSTPAAISDETAADLASTGIDWQPWSVAAFAQAKSEHRLVLLHLGAGWCHWCHVMEHVTYRDPAVVNLIKAHYIAIHVDQDSRPDLANRYEDYGWPATILFDASGKALVKWQGYISPARMRSLLQATVDDPTPGPSASETPTQGISLSSTLDLQKTAALEQRLLDLYDTRNAGWGTVHKYLDADALEYEMLQARAGNTDAARRARDTLNATRKLIDPVWGGIYQYSTDGDWGHPHFEKIMQYQADALRTYAMAYAQWRDSADLASAQAIHHFLIHFLRSPDGAFYTSQDADVVSGEHSADYFALDDAGRRRVGIPRLDTHIYARENGWAIRGLVCLYDVSGDASCLQEAQSAYAWINARRVLPDGGYAHGEHDLAGPYLGDDLAMAQASLALFEATADRAFFNNAEKTASVLNAHFRGPSAGFITAPTASFESPVVEFDENVGVARLSNLLYQYTGKQDFKDTRDYATSYLAISSVEKHHAPAPTLLAAREAASDPVHIAIVGPVNDSRATALYATALQAGFSYLRIESVDLPERPSLRPDVGYPSVQRPAAFFCTNGACSSPVESPEKLKSLIARRTGG